MKFENILLTTIAALTIGGYFGYNKNVSDRTSLVVDECNRIVQISKQGLSAVEESFFKDNYCEVEAKKLADKMGNK